MSTLSLEAFPFSGLVRGKKKKKDPKNRMATSSTFLLFFEQSVQNDSQAIAEVLNQLKDMLANFRGSEKYCYLQNEVFGLFQKLENINGVTDGYLNR